jgi:hypothetical protein
MFSHRRQLRQWAARVLLLWLFGVGSGIAHGCLAPAVSAGLQPSQVAVAVTDEESEATAEPECALHAGLKSDSAAAPDTAPPLPSHCQVFCDESGISIWSVKAAPDHSAIDLPLAPAFAAAAPVPGRSPVHQLMSRRDGGQAPPVSIAFLRLTL